MQRPLAVLLCLFLAGCSSFVGTWGGKAPPGNMPAGTTTLTLKVNSNQTFSLNAYGADGEKTGVINGRWEKLNEDNIVLTTDEGDRIATAKSADWKLILETGYGYPSPLSRK